MTVAEPSQPETAESAVVDSTDTVEQTVTEVIQESVQLVDQVSDYGHLILSSLYLIVGGMLAIYIVHKLVSRLVYPYFKNRRILKVVLGTLYVLILVVAVLLLLQKLGFDVSVVGQISILMVLMGAVGLFFLVPFLPRLPFKIGHLVELSGELGRVDGITTFHTMLRKLDGTMVFIPNALLMAGKIINYHDTPERRIKLGIEAGFDSDLDFLKVQLMKIMQADKRVLDTPISPVVLITDADASGAKVSAFCWVKNADWLSARSDLWAALLKMIQEHEQISLSRSEQDVYVIGENSTQA